MRHKTKNRIAFPLLIQANPESLAITPASLSRLPASLAVWAGTPMFALRLHGSNGIGEKILPDDNYCHSLSCTPLRLKVDGTGFHIAAKCRKARAAFRLPWDP